MNRAVLFLALALIVVGVIGLVALGLLSQTLSPLIQEYGFPNGMMGGRGMMGGFGPGYGRGIAPGGSTITFDKAIDIAREYVASFGNSDLELTEVMEFDNNFYGEAKEKSTGIHAFEFLIDKNSGVASPEMGPNMMWNTKYGHMSDTGFGLMGARGTMGGFRGASANPSAKNSIAPEQAKSAAQKYLDANVPGAKIDDTPDPFYGYYSIHVMKDGKVYGMLSVNGSSGQVWYHTWHGSFVQMEEFD